MRYKRETHRDVDALKALLAELQQRYEGMGRPLSHAKHEMVGVERYIQSFDQQRRLPFDRREHIDRCLDSLANAEEELIGLSHQEWYYVSKL